MIHKGKRFTLWAMKHSGRCQVCEFIEALGEPERKKLTSLLMRTGDHGPPRNEEKFKALRDGICEFKASQSRVLCFFREGQNIVLTNGFIKKSTSTPRQEIDRALLVKQAYNEALKVKK